MRYILPVHLNKGGNTILVKLFCFPDRNEFCLRFGSEDSVRAFVANHGGLRDLVDQVIVPTGDPLVFIGEPAVLQREYGRVLAGRKGGEAVALDRCAAHKGIA